MYKLRLTWRRLSSQFTALQRQVQIILPLPIVKSNVSSVGPSSEINRKNIRIGSTPTFLYFDLYPALLCLRSTHRLLQMDNLHYSNASWVKWYCFICRGNAQHEASILLLRRIDSFKHIFCSTEEFRNGQ